MGENMFKKCRNIAFWVGLSSAVAILCESLSKLIGINIPAIYVEEFIMSICGVLIVLGFVTKDKPESEVENKKNEIENKKNVIENETKNKDLNSLKIKDKNANKLDNKK